MTPESVKAAKAKLDEVLRKPAADAPINIAFGPDLYREFFRRKWFQYRCYKNPAFKLEPLWLLSYGENRIALDDHDVPEEFMVGKRGGHATRP